MPAGSSIPMVLRNQIEGGIIKSTSWTLHQQVRFDKSGITSRDWANYSIVTMPEVHRVEVELIDRQTERAAQGPAAGAIANAFATRLVSVSAIFRSA